MHKKIIEKVLCKVFSKDTFIHENNSSYTIEQDGYFFNIKIDFIETTMLIDVVKDNKTQMYETPYFTFTGKTLTICTETCGDIKITTPLIEEWYNNILTCIVNKFGETLKYSDTITLIATTKELNINCYFLYKLDGRLAIYKEDGDDDGCHEFTVEIDVHNPEEDDYINLFVFDISKELLNYTN